MTVPLAPRLDTRDLRLVLALAASGSTTRAATVMHLTQPAVSRALLLAEEKVGARLFERSGRGLTPTPAGERLIAGAGPLLAGLAELERQVVSQAGPARVRLVCECYTAYRWLPAALTTLRRTLPALEVTLAVEHTEAPVRALEEGALDIALLTNSPVGPGIVERPLFSDEIVFVVAASHPLARTKALTRQDLRSHRLITTHAPETERRWFWSRVFGRRAPKLHVERYPLTEVVLDLARAGLGIAILSDWVIGPYLAGGDLVSKRLEDGALLRPWRLAYRKSVAETAERLHPALLGLAPRAVAPAPRDPAGPVPRTASRVRVAMDRRALTGGRSSRRRS